MTAREPMMLSASADVLASAAVNLPFEGRLSSVDRNGENLRARADAADAQLAARVA